MFIQREPNENGYYGNMYTVGAGDMLEIPVEFETIFQESNGFVTLTLNDNDEIINVVTNTEAKNYWLSIYAEQILHDQRIQQICEAKEYLSSTDYIACKIAEGSATIQEYADIIEKRQAKRELINELEALINND